MLDVSEGVRAVLRRGGTRSVLVRGFCRALASLPGVSTVRFLDGAAQSVDEHRSGSPSTRLPVEAEGRSHGVLLFATTGDAVFDAHAPFARMLASSLASALETARLKEQALIPRTLPGEHDDSESLHRTNVALAAEISARGRTEAALKFLAEASVALAESLDYRTIVSRVARLAVPAFSDWCVVDLVRDDGTVERVEVAHADPAQKEIAVELQRHTVDEGSDSEHPAAQALAWGRAVLLESVVGADLRDLVQDEAHLAALRATGARSLLTVPMMAHGRTLGVLTFALSRGDHRYGSADKAIAEQLAHRAALSIDNARLYLEATQKTESLQAASRTKDEFLAMLGHELRNPLAPILTALHLMRGAGEDAFHKERAIIERQTRHLMRLVDDLLDVSRITRGKIMLCRRTVDVASVVAKAVETASPLLEERGHRLTTNVPRAGLSIEGDEHRLAQVVSNLLTNAAKYTPASGSIVVSAGRDGDSVLLSVKDSGLGIDPELLPRVFDQFVQGQRGLDRSEGGLGLGLAIVRSLVEMHRGQVCARSEGRGKGSEFIVRLPWAEGAATERSAVPAAQPSQAFRARRVLVVDDNRDAAQTLGEALEEAGHTTRVTFDAPAALRLAEEFQPEVAVLDIGLPVMDGYELGRRLRALPSLGRLRLIALTGYGQDSDRTRSDEAGFDAHLVKPVDVDAVARAIDDAEGKKPDGASSGTWSESPSASFPKSVEDDSQS
jgi:signal transduction histidine kinase/CheY-like chemotaxis protein